MKKILVLGSVNSSLEVVRQARKMGYYTIVVSNAPGEASAIADEFVQIDIKDKDAIVKYICTNKIDGVFTGPSEFLTRSMIDICEATGLRCYATSSQWDICQNKKRFKDLCKQFGVPCTPDFHLTAEMKADDLRKIQYPVIVKPVDSYSSNGISVCYSEESIKDAIDLALSFSPSKSFLVEKYITNDCGFSCRYIANNGDIKLSITNDRYTVDKAGGRAMISGLALYPSIKTEEYIEDINPNVITMLKSIGLNNGTCFMQALIDDDGQIYFHEMGLRLSGGLLFRMYEETCGFNDLEMMIHYAMEGVMASYEEMLKIDPFLHGKTSCLLTIPLKAGVINKIYGINEIKSNPNVVEFVQYYKEKDTIKDSYIGTLNQHFGRVKMVANDFDVIKDLVHCIHNTLKIIDEKGNSLIYKNFDLNRISKV